MEARTALQLDRLDRHVWCSHLRMSAGMSRYRAASALEEALRLADLPGEREGRHYYFRQVSLGPIPAHAGRRLWTDRVQQALGDLAATAVHAGDPRAASSNAVYFDNQEQALEALLRRSLRPGATPAWYHCVLLGDPPDTGGSLSRLRIVQRLRESLPPAAGAAIIVSSLSHLDPAVLLQALPVPFIRDWLREMDSAADAAAQSSSIELPASVEATVQRAAEAFGWQEPRTIWLAALGVMAGAPAAPVRGGVLKTAHALLQQMALGRAHERCERGAAPLPAGPMQPLRFENEPEEAGGASRGAAGGANRGAVRAVGTDAVAAAVAAVAVEQAGPVAAPVALLGEPTGAAGLYFLLHAMRQLGIADALAASPALVECRFAAHILNRLAAHAKVAAHDPIRHGLELERTDFAADGPFIDPRIWPRSWPVPAPGRRDGPTLLRIWALAVRRWCRRTGGISVREIVVRKGQVWLTRSDLDVTLPLSALDVRIRRIGLDINPGWLPWFGRFGRVVRFHYRDPTPGEGAR